jgi:hypothetical protein
MEFMSHELLGQPSKNLQAALISLQVNCQLLTFSPKLENLLGILFDQKV